ncbi:glycogen synthase, Corynebacterium family [Thermoplasmatales archaeon]|nr:glycogen synthase, Corynebacterium family [Thermoplasmatales archaeon]
MKAIATNKKKVEVYYWSRFDSDKKLAGGDIRALYMLPEMAKISKNEVMIVRPDHVLSQQTLNHRTLMKVAMVFALPFLLIKKSIMGENSIEFIYCTTCYAWDTLPAILTKFITGSKVICVSHDTPLQKVGFGFFRKHENMSISSSLLFTVIERLQEFLLRFVDIPIAISEFAKSFFGEDLNGDRIILSSNGVPSVVSCDEIDQQRIFDVVYVGRVIYRKNIPNLLKALSLNEFSPPLKLALISNSDEAKIKEIFDENLKSDTVKTVVYHEASEEEKYKVLKKSKISINISNDENFSISTIESASCGTALILSDSDFFREIYNDSAIYVQSDDPVQIRNALDLLLNDVNLLKVMQARAVKIAENYKYENVATKEYGYILDRMSENGG